MIIYRLRSRKDYDKMAENKTNKKIWLASPHMSDEGYEMQYVQEAFDTNWVAPLGPNVNEFENELAAKVGSKHAAALNSGTGAIHLALKAASVGGGDIVLCPTLTFSATANPIIYENAIPVFIDSDYETWNMDHKALEAALQKYGDKVKAVLVVHVYGLSADMDKIMEIAKKYNLYVIEDAAQGVMSKYNGQALGTIGDFGAFSFHETKNYTMGEGGAVYTNNALLNKCIRSFRDWGRDCVCPSGKDNLCGHRFDKQYGELPLGYDHKYVYSHFGYNLKATDMQAAVGCAQLEKFPSFVERRRHNFDRLRAALADIEDKVILPVPCENSRPSWFGFLITVKEGIDRKAVVEYVESHGVQTRNLFAGNLIKLAISKLFLKNVLTNSQKWNILTTSKTARAL